MVLTDLGPITQTALLLPKPDPMSTLPELATKVGGIWLFDAARFMTRALGEVAALESLGIDP